MTNDKLVNMVIKTKCKEIYDYLKKEVENTSYYKPSLYREGDFHVIKVKCYQDSHFTQALFYDIKAYRWNCCVNVSFEEVG